MAVLGVLASSLLPLLMMFLLFALGLVAFVRIVPKGKMLCTFHGVRKKFGGLLKIDTDNNCVWLHSRGDPKGEKYDIIDELIEEIDWPGGFPNILQTTVRSLDFVLHDPVPKSLTKKSGVATARANKLITNENVLAAVYMHAQHSLGLKGGRPSMLVLAILVAIIGISLFGAYMGMQANSSAQATSDQIQIIKQALGVR